jgi:CRP/FNR family transcriptional regulator, cyclic AMP receptor protein
MWMDAASILARTQLFADALETEQVGYLASQSRPAFFRAGTRLMNQGDFGGAMFVIVSGDVSVNLIGADDSERAVAKLGPGDVVGEMSLFTGDRRTATVEALTNVDAIEITKTSLERIFTTSPGLVDRFAEVLAKRQAELRSVSAAEPRSTREAFIRQARSAFTSLFRLAR